MGCPICKGDHHHCTAPPDLMIDCDNRCATCSSGRHCPRCTSFSDYWGPERPYIIGKPVKEDSLMLIIPYKWPLHRWDL